MLTKGSIESMQPRTRVVHIAGHPMDLERDVYIGRAGKGYDGYFGNPHVMRTAGRCFCGAHHDREGAITAFHDYFNERIAHDEVFKKRVEGLRGKFLVCFCAPLPCHGDVYVEYLEGT